MKYPYRLLKLSLSLCLLGHLVITHAQEQTHHFDVLKNSVTLYASFDDGLEADFAKGDSRLILAPSYDHKGDIKHSELPGNIIHAADEGYTGAALHFQSKATPVIYYSGKDNITYNSNEWSGTVSLWLRLNPDEDLAPGYTDPIQITDVGYDDAAIWVDFSNVNPRQFRMGLYGDRDVWNPDNIGPDENPNFQNRLLVASKPPFSREKWTHVVITFEHLNGDAGIAKFYIDALPQGSKEIPEPFTWDVEKSKIYLGLSYVGFLDEVSIFDRALSQPQVAALKHWKGGLKKYFSKKK